MDSQDDEIVGVLPIHYSNGYASNIQVHQFPLLTRPLQAPPSAILAGKRITARIKSDVHRLEVHVPADSRPEVWNVDRAKELGAARAEDDREKNQELRDKPEDEEPRLSEVRLKSEEIPQRGVHMLGIVRDGKLHLHPINQTHQLRPTLTYLDILSRRSKRGWGGASDSDSDDGPPPDPDEPARVPIAKKEKKPAGELKEVQVSARKIEDKGSAQALGSLSTVRKEFLHAIRVEEDSSWKALQFYDVSTVESEQAFERVFSQSDQVLECSTDMTAFLRETHGL